MSNPGIPFTVLAFLLVIGPLIFVHELGHYFVGRWFGVKADTFSIGFGREIAGWTDRRGTRWKVGWLPLGGYVKFAGDMNPASTPSDEWLSLPAAERARTFQAKKLWQRFIIVAAGPVTNFLFAIVAFMVLFAAYRLSRPRRPIDRRGRAGQRRRRPPASGPATGSSPSTAARIDRFADLSPMSRSGPSEPMHFERRARRRATIAIAGDAAPQVDADRFGNEARIGRLGIGRSGAASSPGCRCYRLPARPIDQTVRYRRRRW